ncbi:sigma-70 family RNA polymerase sigma factor [bacterium]|nr:sigma-70 family RNA polymerase sigma factor [bacterium]
MELELEEQRNLIAKFVRANIKYQGNEDLFEDFCNEAYQKSYIIFNSSSSIQKIESYVQKVVNTSIVTVLKDLGRLKRTSTGYIRNREISFDTVTSERYEQNIITSVNTEQKPIVETVPTTYISFPQNITYDIEDPKIGIEEKIIKKDLLQKIADAVCVVHSDNPGKCYLEIYEARYIKGLKQKEIASMLNISQSEISKRLIELSKLIKFRIET